MTDVFDDLQADDTSGDSPDTNESTDGTVTVTDSAVYGDDVRTTLPDPDETRTQLRYEDPESGEKADDVDARALFRTPTLNELRYYAREGPYGRAIIRKPIHDAFKHGYEIVGDNTASDDTDGKIAQFLDDYEDIYLRAETKARRDGMAIIMFQFADAAESAADPIDRESASFQGFEIFTVDNLSEELAESTVADHVDELDSDQIYVSEGGENGGVAVVDDLSHPDHGDVLGFGIEPRNDDTNSQTVSFVHADRTQHLVWGEHVDGPLGNDVTGAQIGESVLTPVLQPLKATQMGYWAMSNILHRYSAPLHAVEPPESWSSDQFDDAREKLGDLSMSSEAVLPPGAELSVAEGVSEFDPQPVYDVLVESICAGTVFTKSVLQGVQTGTVSGSETDVKGYFNEVQLIRSERISEKFHEAVQTVARYDQATIPRVAGVTDFGIDWGPLFKPNDLEQAEGAVSLITAATNGIKNYVLTPDEARSLVSEEWATFDIDVDLAELSETEWDQLDRINIREAGQGPRDDDPLGGEGSVRENPRQQNGGGQPAGQTRESSQPTRDSQSRQDLPSANADDRSTRDSADVTEIIDAYIEGVETTKQTETNDDNSTDDAGGDPDE